MKNKISDQVVIDDNGNFIANKLTYGSNIGAPSIEVPDTNTFKRKSISIASKDIQNKYDEIKKLYESLIEQTRIDQMIYESEIRFEPIINNVYHLYMRKDQTTFLSIISPNEWKQTYIGSFKLTYNYHWEKVNI